MRKLGFSIFVVGCIAILAAGILGFLAKRASRDSVAGAPPAQRGFVLDLAAFRPASWQREFEAMRGINATGVVLLADPARSELPAVLSAARDASLTPWLAIPPAETPDAYSASAHLAGQLALKEHVPYLVLGLGLPTDFAEKGYWINLLKSLRATAPQTKLVFVAAHDEYMWVTWWPQTDVLAATGEFPLPSVKSPGELLPKFRSAWSTQVQQLIKYASKFERHRTDESDMVSAALIDISVPPGYSFGQREVFLRALIQESKRRAYKWTGGAITYRPQLAGTFLRGWEGPEGGLRAHSELFRWEWQFREEAAATASAPASTSQTR